MEATIFDIQRFCVHDGPGIRTTVFFKGCPLRCIWCHNPESHKIQKSIAYYKEKCVSCGACSAVCTFGAHTFDSGKHTFNRNLCTFCSKCTSECAFSALEMLGRQINVNDLVSEVLRDKTFYKNSGGGVTLSGGEPLMQGKFAIEFLKALKSEGIHTCIETCGYADKEIITEASKYTDIFLFDIKETNDEKHQKLTGVPFAKIRENILALNSLGANVILRCPLVYGVNTEDEHLLGIAKIASELDNLIEINVMAYHVLGNAKYSALEIDNQMLGHDAMSKEQKTECINKITDFIQTVSEKNIKIT